jgi:hypothetical protein
MAALPPEMQAANAYARATQRHTSLLKAFERALRIVDELYQRLEKSMYDPRDGQAMYSSKHASDAVALSRALAQAGAVHARLLEQDSARVDAMSDDEKLQFMLLELRRKPLAIRQQVAAALLAGS